MTAPISNEPTTTRLHHYAGHYYAKEHTWAYAARFIGTEGSDARDGLASVSMGASGPDYGAAGRKKLAQHEVVCAISAKQLAQHAIKHSFCAILPALGECCRAIAIDSRRWANFVAPMLLTAPQHVTVSTNAGTSGRRYETHDAFAR